MAATLITPAELAATLGTDARTTRKFLRSITPKENQPGKGSRWAIKGTKTELAKLTKQFAAFTAAEAARKAAREAKEATPEVEVEVEVETDDSLDSLEGPTDEELTDEVDSDV